jgi:hypothetical protein
MSFEKYLRVSLAVVAVAVIGVALLSASTAHADTCVLGSSCVTCFDQCQDGVICSGFACSDGSQGGGCNPCVVTKMQPGAFQKRSEKVVLAELLSKDPELSQGLRSLR